MQVNWIRADLLAVVCDVYCDFVTFPFGIPGEVWYLIVSTPDLCCLSYFNWIAIVKEYIILTCTDPGIFRQGVGGRGPGQSDKKSSAVFFVLFFIIFFGPQLILQKSKIN